VARRNGDARSALRTELVSGALGGGVVERGRLYVERPGRLRFDYTEPERKVAIVVDDRTWLYLDTDRQMLLDRLDAGADLLPTLLAGSRPLGDLFTAALDPPTAGSGDGVVRLVLRPEGADADLERITVVLRPPGYAIEAAEVLDGAGNRMVYAFTSVHRNARLPRGVFAFEPPRGTEIRGSHDESPGAGS
jgi:outer membrane lipoprotein carrier protein